MPRKSKLALARSRAAKKGWVTRRRNEAARKRKRKRGKRYHGVEIEVGYRGRDNSFTMTVIINTHRPIRQYDDGQLAELVERLAQQGHFDESPNNPTSDLRWTFINSWKVVRRNVRIGRGKARLRSFDRTAPGTP